MITAKQRRRLSTIGIGGAVLAVAVALVLVALQNQIVFFKTPSDLARQAPAPGQRIRIGGLVKQHSLQRRGGTAYFTVTDTRHDIPARYEGILPDLFSEGQGVVADGLFRDGMFIAERVLAKHDETYMPKEVADALRAEGVWRGPKEF